MRVKQQGFATILYTQKMNKSNGKFWILGHIFRTFFATNLELNLKVFFCSQNFLMKHAKTANTQFHLNGLEFICLRTLCLRIFQFYTIPNLLIKIYSIMSPLLFLFMFSFTWTPQSSDPFSRETHFISMILFLFATVEAYGQLFLYVAKPKLMNYSIAETVMRSTWCNNILVALASLNFHFSLTLLLGPFLGRNYAMMSADFHELFSR